MELEPCLIPSCRATGPHQHPLLAEGTFGPPKAPSDEARVGHFERIDAKIVTLHHRCPSCGAEAYRPYLTMGIRPLPPEPVVRDCDDCLGTKARAEYAARAARRAERRQLQAPRRAGS